ncbi:PilZ domain-containing protein [Sphingomonas sp. CJ20]
MIQGLRSATIFSLAVDPPAGFATDSDPTAEFDAACIVTPHDRHACAVRRLGPSAATVRLEATLEAGTPLDLELANGQSIPGTLAWLSDGEARVDFDTRIDVIGTLARTLARLPAERRRMPRVEFHQTVCVRHGGRVVLGKARNIAQGGVRVELPIALAEGDGVQMTFDGLRPLDGTVAWANGHHAGIAFAEEVSWQVLMPWLRMVQRDSAGTGRAPEAEGLIPDPHAIRIEIPARIREGVRWWNAKVCAITAHLVELETRAQFLPGTQLWISLPEIGGGPAKVIDTGLHRILCEFRLPLRPNDLRVLTGKPAPR